MAKKVKVSECCVITTDDKGQRTLVGKAKEALTSMSKNKIEVTIMLEDTKKEDAEKFLKENNVPYTSLMDADEIRTSKPKFDACIIGDNNVVLLRNDWEWTINQVIDKLYDNREKEQHKSEQQKMDDKFNDYKRWAEEANKAYKKRNQVVQASAD